MHEESDHILFKNIARIYYVADGDDNPLVERVMRYFIGLECRVNKTYVNSLKGKADSGDSGVGPQTVHIDEYAGQFRLNYYFLQTRI